MNIHKLSECKTPFMQTPINSLGNRKVPTIIMSSLEINGFFKLNSMTAPALLGIGHHGLFVAPHQEDNYDYF